MSLSVTSVTQQAPTSTGTQDFTVAGFGAPDVVMMILSKAPATIGDLADGGVLSVGVTDGTSERAWFTVDDDNVASATVDRGGFNTAVLVTHEPESGGNRAERRRVAFDSFITDGVRVNHSAVASDAEYITCVMFRGDVAIGDIDNIKWGETSVVSSLSFEPNGVICLGSLQDIDNPTVPEHTQYSGFGFGFVHNPGLGDRYLTQHCVAVNARDDSVTSGRATGVVSDTYAWMHPRFDDIDRGYYAVKLFEDFTSSGFTVREVGGDPTVGGTVDKDGFTFIAFQTDASDDVKVGLMDVSAATGSQSFSGFNIQPDFLFAGVSKISKANVRKDNDAEAEALGLSISTANDDHFHGYAVQNATGGNTNTNSISDDQAIKAYEGDGTAHFEATRASFDSDGVTYNFTTAVSSAKWPFIAIGTGDNTPTTKSRDVDQVTFFTRTTTGNFDILTRDLGGKTPGLALFASNHAFPGELSGNDGDGLKEDNKVAVSVGAYDGTSQWLTSQRLEHSTNWVANRLMSTSRCAGFGGNEVSAVQFLSEVDTGITGVSGIRLSQESVVAAAPVTVTLVAEDILTNVDVGTLAVGDSGTTSTPSLGWKPDLILAASGGDTFASGGSGNFFLPCFGAAYDNGSAIVQRSLILRIDGGSNLPDLYSQIVNDAIVGQKAPTTGLAWSAEVTTIDATAGFEVTVRDGNAGDDIGYVALQTGRATWVGDTPVPTSTGVQSYTGPGFTPQWVGKISSLHTAYNNEEQGDDAAGFGFSGLVENHQYQCGVCVLNITFDEAALKTIARQPTFLLDGGGGTELALSQFDGFTADGWDEDYDLAPASARQGFGFAIEEAPEIVTGILAGSLGLFGVGQ